VHVNLVVAEIGSTTTVVNAFSVKKEVAYLGQGVAQTTVNKDVNIGLREAIKDLKAKINRQKLKYNAMYATSSAAGGLKMTVSGLVYDMTVKAAREAALNAGANIHLVTAGPLLDGDYARIEEIKPNIILVSGGTDYGDKTVALENLIGIAQMNFNTPIIYAGNIENHERIKNFMSNHNQKDYVTLVENVYPRLDFMNIQPLRRKIYEIFEKHIIHAPGMQHIKDMVEGAIMPTPGSVMEAAMLMHESLGNLLVIDVGGATTDIHSITDVNEEFQEHYDGEPKEKRTVEGDLGVFVNYQNVVHQMGKNVLATKLNLTVPELDEILENYNYKPQSDIERRLVYELTRHCVFTALDRHIGDYRTVYTSSGRKIVPEGRDLTQVQSVILTGGALIYLENTENIIQEYFKSKKKKMVPTHEVVIYKDSDYIMSSMGVLSLDYEDIARKLMETSLRINEV